MVRVIARLVGCLLLFAACSASDEPIADERDGFDAPDISVLPPAEPTPQPSPDEAVENPDDGRIVVQGADFQLSTMLPDGTEAEVLTDDPTVANTQPSWAPDGSRVAWVSVNQLTGAAAISSDRYDRSDRIDIPVETPPFYLYWDASAARIAHLTPNPGGIDLGVAEPFAEDGPTTRRIDRGQPYFFAWGPDGDELMVHASQFRFDRIDLGSATIIVDEFPGSFGAPVWLPDDGVFYVDVEDDQQFLVATGPSGEGRRPLVTFDGSIRFAISNDGNRIAMQVSPNDSDGGEVQTASSPTLGITGSIELEPVAQTDPTPEPTPGFDSSLDEVEELLPNLPYMMGTFGGSPFLLSDRPALALLPSPDGQTIAWLEVSDAGDSFTWQFETNTRRIQTPEFVISREFGRNYLPFFDQYAASHDYWSPSSSLFVYAGRPVGSDEPDGIWVMDTTTGEVERIADGVYAAFTRTPSAGGAASSL